MNSPLKLSLEQQFNIRHFETQVQQMNREEVQAYLVKLYEQMLLLEAMYKRHLLERLGLEPPRLP
ncbi:MAG: NblA-related protein [Leptolyngbyaceae cyanobacterium RU_5_1]|nr:NblA-related protein [Leptolyngbyaceae cyanobacterium RU_5_1]